MNDVKENYLPVMSSPKQEQEYYEALLAFLAINPILKELREGEFSIAKLNTLINKVNQKLNSEKVASFSEKWVDQMANYQADQFNYQFDRTVNVDKEIKEAKLYHYVYTKQYVEEIKFIIESAIVFALITKAGRDVVDEYILGKQDALNNRIKMLAEDGTIKVVDSLTRAKLILLGYNSYEWQTMEDDRVRHSHKELQGKRLSLHRPHPTEGFPGVPTHCRCIMKNPSREWV